MKRVTIIGGGVAGLSLAASLDPTRFLVRLLEAQPERTSSGAALGVWPAARRALDRMGVWRAVIRAGAPGSQRGSLHTITGRPLVSAHAPGLRLVERSVLMRALVDAVPAAVQVENTEVLDPAEVDGDLVIGADGVRSRVRGLVDARRAERVETPYVALRAVVGLEQARPASGPLFGEYWGGGRLFGIARLADERVYWFNSWRSRLGPEPLDVGAAVREARSVFAGAAPVIEQLLARAGAADGTLATRLWVAPAMRRYARDRYVVVGDAAHASLPNLGRGACDAIVDAVTLAGCLNEGGSLTRWQARRLPQTQVTRAAAASVMRLALALPAAN